MIGILLASALPRRRKNIKRIGKEITLLKIQRSHVKPLHTANHQAQKIAQRLFPARVKCVPIKKWAEKKSLVTSLTNRDIQREPPQKKKENLSLKPLASIEKVGKGRGKKSVNYSSPVGLLAGKDRKSPPGPCPKKKKKNGKGE